MQEPDRKLAWSGVFVLATLAVEFALALAVVGPQYKEAHSAAARAAEAQGYQDYSWWEYSGGWIAGFTLVLTASTIALWWVTWKAAIAAADQSAALRKSIWLEHRPILSFGDWERPGLSAGVTARIKTHLLNVGRGSAKLVSGDVKARIASSFPANVGLTSTANTGYVRPGAHGEIATTLTPTQQDIADLISGNKKIYFWGCAHVEDEFGGTCDMGFGIEYRWNTTQYDFVNINDTSIVYINWTAPINL